MKIFLILVCAIVVVGLLSGCATHQAKESPSYHLLASHGLTDIAVDERYRISYRCGLVGSYVLASFTAKESSGKSVSGVICRQNFYGADSIQFD